jgi:RNA polymerase sigma-70 factor (ECF subfamily)
MAQGPQAQLERDERELIARVLAGEHEAFYELVRPYERAIFFAARGVVDNDADAEEVAQETVLKAFTHLKSFRAEAKFSTWLIQIAINEARMKVRKNHAYLYDSLDDTREDEEGDYFPKDYSDWRPIPSEALATKELREALNKAIAGLAPKYREVLLLRDVQQMNIAETAKALNISEQNVRTRLLRARLMVRDALAPGYDGMWASGREYQKIRPW